MSESSWPGQPRVGSMRLVDLSAGRNGSERCGSRVHLSLDHELTLIPCTPLPHHCSSSLKVNPSSPLSHLVDLVVPLQLPPLVEPPLLLLKRRRRRRRKRRKSPMMTWDSDCSTKRFVYSRELFLGQDARTEVIGRSFFDCFSSFFKTTNIFLSSPLRMDLWCCH